MSRPGLVNASGSTYDALFLKQFSGEVMTAFEQANVMIPLTTVRTITNGKSAQFPSVGVAQAGYHTPGSDLLDSTAFTTGTAFKQAETTITVDDLLVSTTFVPEIEELENHYDIRSIYSTEMGRALAYTSDKQLIQLLAIAGYTTAFNTDHTVPTRPILDATLFSGTLTTAVEAFIGACYTAATRFDEVNVPKGDRYAIVQPDTFYKLYRSGISDVAKTVLFNKDVTSSENGSLVSPGEMLEIGGIKIMKSNHTPYAKIATSVNDGIAGSSQTGPAKYRNSELVSGQEGTKIVTTFFTKQAIGTLKLMDLSMQSEYRIDRQGTLLVARYAMGHGVLRPECCINLTKAS
jgi:hypothetical protein